MLGKVVVLLGHEYTLLEEVLVDLLAVGLGDKPAIELVRWSCGNRGRWMVVHCCEFLALFGESHTMLIFEKRNERVEVEVEIYTARGINSPES